MMMHQQLSLAKLQQEYFHCTLQQSARQIRENRVSSVGIREEMLIDKRMQEAHEIRKARSKHERKILKEQYKRVKEKMVKRNIVKHHEDVIIPQTIDLFHQQKQKSIQTEKHHEFLHQVKGLQQRGKILK